MDEILLDAVDQFVKGNGWSGPINEFIGKHSHLFSENDSEEYDVEQYDVFLQFGELIDSLLRQVVQDLGCSEDMLITILKDSVNKESRSTRDDQIKALLDTILMHDDFPQFHTLMLSNGVPGAVASEESTTGTGEEESALASAEYVLQETLARSLLEAEANGHLEPGEEELLVWAKAVIEMKEISQQYEEEQQEDHVEESEAEQRMRELQITLNQEVGREVPSGCFLRQRMVALESGFIGCTAHVGI